MKLLNSNFTKSQQATLLALWLTAYFVITVLSIFGRTLQHWTFNNLGFTATAWIIGLSIAGLVAVYLVILKRHSIALPGWQLAWFLPLFLLAPLLLDRIEERLHFLTFGLLGALSVLLFKPRIAVVVCLAGSASDELLQHFLPDRVGDLRDVSMNAVAALAAAYFVHASNKQPRQA